MGVAKEMELRMTVKSLSALLCAGVCLWNTKETDFNVMKSPCGRDLAKELAEACARRSMKLGSHYSNPDWNHPNAWNPKSTRQLPAPNPGDEPDTAKCIAFVKAQITELKTEVVCMPNAWGTDRRPTLRVCDIPAGALANESVVLRPDFAPEPPRPLSKTVLVYIKRK